MIKKTYIYNIKWKKSVQNNLRSVSLNNKTTKAWKKQIIKTWKIKALWEEEE
jgi:hypothetical protein